jgi:UDP-N-acetylglucosamine--N-acetylmuramyl-(pentapeptide) pyrophosphoryl-undecaprenol N-acetylglucosamine transferase
MRLLLAGGGTGGHLFPAVAIAEGLKQEEPQSEVLFVGTRKGLEARLLPELGWTLKTIDMSGWAGLGLSERVRAFFRMIKGLRQSRRIIRDFRPDVVVGVGGYASVPALLAAKWMRVPYLIHEQNAWPGMANRLLARWAKRICLSFEAAGKAFPGLPTTVTGNPVRSAMEHCPELNLESPVLLVFGGSQGARGINRAIVDGLSQLEGWRDQLHILHQAGQLDYEEVVAGYRMANWENVEVVPFITEMAEAYCRATLVVCRAGATTLAELTACGRPAILVPFPHAAGGHQADNARALAAKGAAVMVEEKDLTPGSLGRLIDDLLQDAAKLKSLAASAGKMAQRGAAARILNECRAVLNAVD